MFKKESISIIGAGNLAYHLVPVLFHSGYLIRQVIARNSDKAAQLAALVGASCHTDIKKVDRASDFLFFLISDDAIESLAAQTPKIRGMVVHCSGSQPLNILKTHQDAAVLYPLYSFSSTKLVNFQQLPLFIQASDETNESLIKELALSISTQVIHSSDEERLQLHLAAVFANNFTTQLVQEAFALLRDANIDPKWLMPIINQSFQRFLDQPESDLLSGPARRGDVHLIKKHIDLLSDKPQLQQAYKFLSDWILNKYHEKL